MKKNLNYFNYEERNGLFLLAFLLVLFCTFIFLQKRILPKETSISIVHNQILAQETYAQSSFDQGDNSDQISSNMMTMRKKIATDSLPPQELKKVESAKKTTVQRKESTYTPKKQAESSKKETLKKEYKKKSYDQKWTKNKKNASVSINSQDAEEWEEIYGIGPKYAARIIKYQKWLGGFHSKEQLMEVYGINDTIFSEIKDHLVDSKPYELIQINTAEAKDLAKHPYLGWKEANAIIKYRKHHGDYNSIDDLKKVLVLQDNIIQKIKPYLHFTSATTAPTDT